LQNASVEPSISKLSCSLLDPNPSLIDKDGELINNTNLAASLTTYRNGTIADGISKLILIANSKNPLQFSINDTKPDNLTNGTLCSLNQSSNVNNLSSTVNGSPQYISDRKSVVAVVYTPPDPLNQATGSKRTINVNVSDPNDPAGTLLEVPNIHLSSSCCSHPWTLE
jgi:hypothetical protein